jgi:hypothetical protein
MIEVKKTPEERLDLLMSIVLDIKMELPKMRREMLAEVEKQIDKQIESKLSVIETRLALREAVKLRQLLVEKSLISEDEFLAKLKE